MTDITNATEVEKKVERPALFVGVIPPADTACSKWLASDAYTDASRLPQGTTAFRLPSTADAARAKERERLIADVVAAVGRWNNNYTVSALEVIRAADALAAFDADNGGSKKSNPTDAAELERLRGVEDEAASQLVIAAHALREVIYSDPVFVAWREARANRIAFEKKITSN